MSKSGYGDSMGYSAKGSKKMAAEYRSDQKKKFIAKKMSRSIDIANEKAKKPHSIFRGRDYLGTKKGSKNYKGEYKY